MLVAAKRYEVDISLCGKMKGSHTFTAILDTELGPHMSSKDDLSRESIRDRPTFYTSLQTANVSTSKVDDIVRLWVSLGGHINMDINTVVHTLTAKAVLGTAFIDKHVRCIEPDRHWLAAMKGSRLSTIALFSKETIATMALEDKNSPNEFVCKERRLRTIPSYSESSILPGRKASRP